MFQCGSSTNTSSNDTISAGIYQQKSLVPFCHRTILTLSKLGSDNCIFFASPSVGAFLIRSVNSVSIQTWHSTLSVPRLPSALRCPGWGLTLRLRGPNAHHPARCHLLRILPAIHPETNNTSTTFQSLATQSRVTSTELKSRHFGGSTTPIGLDIGLQKEKIRRGASNWRSVLSVPVLVKEILVQGEQAHQKLVHPPRSVHHIESFQWIGNSKQSP